MILRALTLLVLLTIPHKAQAFCGFYVAKAEADLFNKASKVVLARHEDRTVMTMANDFQGGVSDFAIVIPVPEVLEEGQINVAENSLIDHLDAYTAPRLVEYFDDNPCARQRYMAMRQTMAVVESAMSDGAAAAKALGVTIEAEYTVGEYDILILSAEESEGLLTWLNREGYNLPAGAEPVVNSYLKQDMKFFVAKVNLDAFEQTGYTYLRPLQVAVETDKFMLPIRLGTVNAQGPQDLILFTLTRKGRVEPVNYRTVKIPTGMDIPLFVEEDFGSFYKDMFARQVEKENLKAVVLEYAWDMSWCDPCAADPLPNDDLRTLGAWWVEPGPDRPDSPIQPMNGRPQIMPVQPGGPVDVFVTRLHMRYTAESFPEDLILQETPDRQNFQGRYVMRHPWTGEDSCEAADRYREALPARFEEEARTLARLTGWEMADIRARMEDSAQSFTPPDPAETRPWWERMWEKD